VKQFTLNNLRKMVKKSTIKKHMSKLMTTLGLLLFSLGLKQRSAGHLRTFLSVVKSGSHFDLTFKLVFATMQMFFISSRLPMIPKTVSWSAPQHLIGKRLEIRNIKRCWKPTTSLLFLNLFHGRKEIK